MRIKIYALLGSMVLILMPFVSKAWTQANVKVQVSAEDDYFNPKMLTVSPGTTVTWVSQGKAPHTVTSDNGAFDSGVLGPGNSYSYTFNTPGTYPYHCKFHGGPGGVGMSGTVSVVAPGQGG